MTSRDVAALGTLIAAVVCAAVAGFLASAVAGFATLGACLFVVAVLIGRH